MTRLRQVADAAQWILAVGALAAVVMLFTLEGAPPESSSSPTDDLERLVEGREIYDQRCASCHGDTGQGGQGPRLAGTVLVNYPDAAEEIDVVTNGRNGMPAFALPLNDDEIRAVVAFTRFGLG